MLYLPFAAPPTDSARCTNVICLCLPTAFVSPGAPSVELVRPAEPRDLYSKQHTEATLLGQQHQGDRVKTHLTNTALLLC